MRDPHYIINHSSWIINECPMFSLTLVPSHHLHVPAGILLSSGVTWVSWFTFFLKNTLCTWALSSYLIKCLHAKVLSSRTAFNFTPYNQTPGDISATYRVHPEWAQPATNVSSRGQKLSPGLCNWHFQNLEAALQLPRNCENRFYGTLSPSRHHFPNETRGKCML